MTERQFCYWLQGYFELSESQEISKEQAQIIQDHLQLVFKKETPYRNTDIDDWRDRLTLTPLPSPLTVTC